LLTTFGSFFGIQVHAALRDCNDARWGFGPFGRFSGDLGPTLAQVRADQTGAVRKPLTGVHKGIRRPLVSGAGSDGVSEASSDGRIRLMPAVKKPLAFF
jgi:hypothetical protein